MKANYEDCVKWLNSRNIKLYDYQYIILKAFCNDKQIKTARGIGRSHVAKLFGEYVTQLLSKNNHNEVPEIILTYECGLSSGLFDEKFIDSVREELSYEEFQREYM